MIAAWAQKKQEAKIPDDPKWPIFRGGGIPMLETGVAYANAPVGAQTFNYAALTGTAS